MRYSFLTSFTVSDNSPNRKPTIQPKTVLALCVLAGLWLLVFNQLRLEWTINPLYAYGWAIPVLALYLFWERWQGRPEPASAGNLVPLVIAGACFAALLPIRLVQEANPDWILISWMMNSLAVVVTISVIHFAGGSRWTRHFCFPVLFTFTAVAWPVAFENFALQNLMYGNAVVAAEVLTLGGLPTFVHGNMLSIGGEIVSVDEACSGIRSLQTAFMMSLFFGEFYRLGIVGRLWLVVASFFLAGVLNFGRTLILSYVGGTRGAEALDGWHDPLGMVVLVICLAGLWGVALLFSRGTGGDDSAAAASSAPALARPLPTAFLLLAAGWLILTEAATETWYRVHENNTDPAPQWSMAWPTSLESFREYEFSDTAQTILKFNDGKSASWMSSEGFSWNMYLLRWEPGRVSKNLATAHSPDICLPASGMELRAHLDSFVLEIGDLKLPFRAYTFEDHRGIHYVFHTLAEDARRDASTAVEAGALTREARIASFLRGERNLGQRVIGVSLQGPMDYHAAREALEKNLRSMIRIENENGSRTAATR